MSYFDELWDDTKIEWKTLEEVCNFKNGKGHEKEVNKEGEFIVVNSKFISTSGRVAKYSHNQICPLFVDDILIVMSDLPNGKALAKTFLVDNDDRYTLNQRIGGITIKNKSKILPKFLNYYLSRTQQLLKFDNGNDQTNLRKKQILDVKIPIITQAIQKEIIRFLDTFTELTSELTSELTTELTDRRKQYYYYRDRLLTFDDNEVKHLPMGDESLGVFIRGKRFVKTDMISEGIPCIHYGEMYTHYDTWADETKSFVSKELVEKKNLRLAEKGDVVIVAAGETIEDIGKGTAWLGEEGAVIHDACFYYKSDLNPKYVAYFTRTRQFHDQIKKHIRTGKISAINSKGLGKALIPIPSPKEQERIVSILDKFDILTTSISKGLPKEIELRKKQYEYYRDRLLTFPRKTVETEIYE